MSGSKNVERRRTLPEQAEAAPTKRSSCAVAGATSSFGSSPTHKHSSTPQLSRPGSEGRRSRAAPAPGQPQQRRRVRFAPKTRILLVPSHRDFTDDIIDALWFSEEENSEMQLGIAHTVKAMMRLGDQEFVDDDDNCCRGLEHLWSTDVMKARQERKELLWDAVLDEQDRQYEEGLQDDDRLSEVAVDAAKVSREKALALGIQDAELVKGWREKEALAIYRPTQNRRQFQRSRANATRSLEGNPDQCLTLLERALDVSTSNVAPVPSRGANAPFPSPSEKSQTPNIDHRRRRSCPETQSAIPAAREDVVGTPSKDASVGGGVGMSLKMNLKSLATKKRNNNTYLELR